VQDAIFSEHRSTVFYHYIIKNINKRKYNNNISNNIN